MNADRPASSVSGSRQCSAVHLAAPALALHQLDLHDGVRARGIGVGAGLRGGSSAVAEVDEVKHLVDIAAGLLPIKQSNKSINQANEQIVAGWRT